MADLSINGQIGFRNYYHLISHIIICLINFSDLLVNKVTSSNFFLTENILKIKTIYLIHFRVSHFNDRLRNHQNTSVIKFSDRILSFLFFN